MRQNGSVNGSPGVICETHGSRLGRPHRLAPYGIDHRVIHHYVGRQSGRSRGPAVISIRGPGLCLLAVADPLLCQWVWAKRKTDDAKDVLNTCSGPRKEEIKEGKSDVPSAR